jgi:hypothetical protein
MPAFRSPVILSGCVWLVLASAAGIFGMVQKLTMPLPQVLLFLLTNVLVVCFWKAPQIHPWALDESLRVLVGLHVSRLVGIYFLVLYSRGELPYAFAVPGGWGDIVVATTAMLLVCFVQPRGGGTKLYLLWNMVGFLDILMVVFTAARLGLSDPQSMAALLRFPLSLLPTFLVPIIIATHLLIFFRLLVLRPIR